MKLELKHLAAYLPYNLQLSVPEIHKAFTCELVVTNNTTSFKNGMNIDTAITLNAKPLLRPLSDLTKGISVDGEWFVPLERLEIEGADISFNSLINWLKITQRKENDFIVAFDIYTEIYVPLFKWHFDVYDLIPNNLAIDINTLPNV